MKKLLLISWMCLISLDFFGQSSNEQKTQNLNATSHSFRDVNISLITPNVLYDSQAGTLIGGGLKLRMFVSRRFSFDSDLIVGRDFLHYGPGIVGLPLWCIAASSGINFNSDDGQYQSLAGFLMIGVIMILSGEHFAYHIPVNSNTEISPYLSILRFKQLKNVQGPNNSVVNGVNYNCAIGIEINQYIKRFIVSPYIDYEMAYNGTGHGINIGFSLGYCFYAK